MKFKNPNRIVLLVLILQLASGLRAQDTSLLSTIIERATIKPSFIHLEPEYEPGYVDSVKALKEFAYANDPAYWRKKQIAEEKQPSSFYFSWPAIRSFLMIVIAVLLGWILYRLLSNERMNLFAKSSKKRKKTADETIDESEDQIDKLLKDAERKEDFREAVRIQYLKLLYFLRDSEVLEYHPEWTPTRYIQQLQQHRAYSGFKQLTHIYEYVCFGGFDTSVSRYKEIEKAFSNFRNSL